MDSLHSFDCDLDSRLPRRLPAQTVAGTGEIVRKYQDKHVPGHRQNSTKTDGYIRAQRTINHNDVPRRSK
jgi:hypothetical protein